MFTLTERCFDFLGYTPEQIKSMGSELFAKVLHPDDTQIVAKHHSRFVNAPDNATFDVAFRMKHSSGEWRWLHSRDTLFARTPEGLGKQILGISEDVTEHRKAGEKLCDSEAKYRALVENADDAILLTDLNGKHIYRNPAYYKNLGFDKNDDIDINGFARVHPDDLPKVKEGTIQLFKKGSLTIEYRVKHRDGSWVFRHTKSTLIYNQRHEPYAILAIIRDITERKKAEETLSKSEKRYRNLADSLPEIVFETDTHGKLIYSNERAFKITGYTKENFTKGIFVFDLVEQKDKERAKQHFKKALANKLSAENEYSFLRKDGSTFPAIVVSKPIVVEGGTVGLRGLVIDISERKKAETMLKEAKAQLELQIKRMPIGCILWDKNFKAVSWNPAAEKIFGYSSKEVVGKHPYDTIVPKEAQPVTEKIWRRLLEGDVTANSINDNLTKDGKIITCSWTNTPIKREGKTVIGVLSMAQDITERKKAERTIIESENNYRSLINGMNDAVWVVDFNGNFVDVNDAAVKALKYSKDELLSFGIKDVDKYLTLRESQCHYGSRCVYWNSNF